MVRDLRTHVFEEYPQQLDELLIKADERNDSPRKKGARFGQRRYLAEDEESGAEYVQAFIDNISFPKSLDELEDYIYNAGHYDIESLLVASATEWTAPRWAKAGDIVFFMHAKYARSTITRLRTELHNSKRKYSKRRYDNLSSWIDRGLKLHAQYGGKIFAIARVSGAPSYETIVNGNPDDLYHWKSRVYAKMDRIVLLEQPIALDDFSSFIRVSRQGAITPVFGGAFEQLRAIIGKRNRIPRYLSESISSPIPLQKITEKNWIELPGEYRRRFILESQFRSYYVDYLLRSIKDRRTRVYSECRCKKTGIPDSFVDNVITIDKKYLPVEVKLSVSSEANIKGQVQKYSYDDKIICGERVMLPEMVYGNRVLIVDSDDVYMYDADSDKVNEIFCLDELKDTRQLDYLRSEIVKHL